MTANLETTVTGLTERVEELEREAEDLRRENGWLKEIVTLKSKRMAGMVPELEPSPSSAGASGSSASQYASSSASGGGAESTGSRAGSTGTPPSSHDGSTTDEERAGRRRKGKGRQWEM